MTAERHQADGQAEMRAIARAICRVQLNGGDPDQPAMRWNGTEAEPQEFPAWQDYRDEAAAVMSVITAALHAAVAAEREAVEYELAQLRHAYTHLKAGRVKDQQQFADGLIGHIIRRIEERMAAAPAPREGE